MKESALLVATGLTKDLGGRRVVSEVDLVVRAGEVVGLLGPNGAGKTTTFRLITGLLAPDAGGVTLGGEPLEGPLHERVVRGLGYLPQQPTLLRGLSVLSVIAPELREILEAQFGAKP